MTPSPTHGIAVPLALCLSLAAPVIGAPPVRHGTWDALAFGISKKAAVERLQVRFGRKDQPECSALPGSPGDPAVSTCDWPLGEDSGLVVVGLRPKAMTLFFMEDRLYSISLSSFPPDRLVACMEARAYLLEQFGRADIDSPPKPGQNFDVEIFKWERKPVEVELICAWQRISSPRVNDSMGIDISYSDSAIVAELNARGERARKKAMSAATKK